MVKNRCDFENTLDYTKKCRYILIKPIDRLDKYLFDSKRTTSLLMTAVFEKD